MTGQQSPAAAPVRRLPPNIVQDMRTVETMIRLACRDLHGGNGVLCVECEELLGYAAVRLERCPFQERKTTCARCPIHCYKPEMRAKIAGVMRYAGPRMLWRHPLWALRHLYQERQAPPERPGRPARGGMTCQE